jgi:hypothetical protein
MRIRPKKFKFTKITTIFLLICVLGIIGKIISLLYRAFLLGSYLESFGRSPLISGFGFLFTGVMIIWGSKGKAIESQKERVFFLYLGLNTVSWGLSGIIGGYGYKIIGVSFLVIALVFAFLSLLCLIQNIKLLFL